MKKRTVIALVFVALLLALAVSGVPVLHSLAAGVLAALLILALLWGAWRFLRASLWKVGRRLTFSYFLIGVVPIPLVALLLAALAYLLCGFLLGHLYHDALTSLRGDLARAAESRWTAVDEGAPLGGPDDDVAFALYRRGQRVAGDPRLPEEWPWWVAAASGEDAAAAEPAAADPPAGDDPPASSGGATTSAAPAAAEPAARKTHAPLPLFSTGGPSPAVAVAAGDSAMGVVALYTGDAEAEISRRCDVWVDLFLPTEGGTGSPVQLRVGNMSFALHLSTVRPGDDRSRRFFAARAVGSSPGQRPSLWDRPLLWWSETPGPLLALADGSQVTATFGVSLNGTLRTVQRHLFSSSAEFDAKVWGTLLAFAFLLFDVYVVAALMAVVMIFGLSRAVNRMSTATEAVRAGDFSVRIPVKRRDQVGELQRSFNQMTANLEGLVATATEKEVLEKELAIARDVQKSLLPQDLPMVGERVEFSLLFAPSAAIGGDYFDVFHLGEGRLAVVIADVSGHGLPSGLRMAMLKAALTILVDEGKRPEEILARLDAIVRSDEESRLFVTATLALVDLDGATLELTNAGHPPTYLLRGGAVEEIALPGSPLGGLGQTYGRRTLDLAADDVVVWLSDGLIEATDDRDRAFGYDGVVRALQTAAAAGKVPAVYVRDRLLEAVEAHTGGRPVEDDRTVVVMRYRGPRERAADEDVVDA